MLEKLFYAGVLAALIAGTYGMTYKYGHLSGAMEVKAAWNQENKKRDDAYAELKRQNAEQLATHQQREADLAHELFENERKHEAALSSARTDYALRLQQSEGRAGVYLRQAQGSTVEQQRLARHAAELDRSLEEGRALVRELGETLGQRDRTIKALGGIILNDRTLLSGE